ncbi:MAG: type VI secretion system tube protein TssD [Methanobacteriota archaeon]
MQKEAIKKICVMLVITLLTASFAVALGMKTFAAKGGDGVPMFQEGDATVTETSIEMLIEGQTQGVIEGEGHQGWIEVNSFYHEISVPYENDTGLPSPSEQRQHKPITITKEIDKATPQLYQALCQEEPLTITLSWYRIDPTNMKESWQQYYTITLQNARIVIYKEYDASSPKLFGFNNNYLKIDWTYDTGSSFGESVLAGGNDMPMEQVSGNYRHLEEITFTYEEIEWSYNLGVGGTYGDNWNQALPPK